MYIEKGRAANISNVEPLKRRGLKINGLLKLSILVKVLDGYFLRLVNS